MQIESGSLNSTDTYIELGRNNNPIGLHFTGVEIPAGATITSAEIKFLIYAGHSDATNLNINGILAADAPPLNQEALTDSSEFASTTVSWNNVASWNNTMSRIAIAEDVLKEVFLDRSISWGFATWSGGNGNPSDADGTTVSNPEGGTVSRNFTNYRIGVHDHDDAHQTDLQFAGPLQHKDLSPGRENSVLPQVTGADCFPAI